MKTFKLGDKVQFPYPYSHGRELQTGIVVRVGPPDWAVNEPDLWKGVYAISVPLGYSSHLVAYAGVSVPAWNVPEKDLTLLFTEEWTDEV